MLDFHFYLAPRVIQPGEPLDDLTPAPRVWRLLLLGKPRLRQSLGRYYSAGNLLLLNKNSPSLGVGMTLNGLAAYLG
jgi:hypothetical protein